MTVLAEPEEMPEKKLLAWWLRQRTTVGRRWIGERFWMEEESGVSRAVQRVRASCVKELKRLKGRLLETSARMEEIDNERSPE